LLAVFPQLPLQQLYLLVLLKLATITAVDHLQNIPQLLDCLLLLFQQPQVVQFSRLRLVVLPESAGHPDFKLGRHVLRALPLVVRPRLRLVLAPVVVLDVGVELLALKVGVVAHWLEIPVLLFAYVGVLAIGRSCLLSLLDLLQDLQGRRLLLNRSDLLLYLLHRWRSSINDHIRRPTIRRRRFNRLCVYYALRVLGGSAFIGFRLWGGFWGLIFHE
jgi:hypothetical protein